MTKMTEYIAGFNDGYAFVMHEIEMLMVKETPEGRRALSDLLDHLGYAEAQKTPQTPVLMAQRGRKVANDKA
jgi:hypothetical protein